MVAAAEVLHMTYPQLVDYLRSNSARCRLCAETATDLEVAQILLKVAEEMETAALTLEGHEEIEPSRRADNSLPA